MGRKKYKRSVGGSTRWEKKRIEAVMQTVLGELAGGQILIHPEVPYHQGIKNKHEPFASWAERVRKQRIAKRATGKQKDQLESWSL